MVEVVVAPRYALAVVASRETCKRKTSEDPAVGLRGPQLVAADKGPAETAATPTEAGRMTRPRGASQDAPGKPRSRRIMSTAG